MKKQLELIKNVCDSMLSNNANESISVNSSCTPSIQLRNNISPSPLFSEATQYAIPNTHMGTNFIAMHPFGQTNWLPQNNPDISNYQNFLATNNLQSQAFMINTLNQCCQMLWLQQKELASLRNTVSIVSIKSR